MDATQTNTDVPSNPACPGCDQRDRQIAELQKLIAELERRNAQRDSRIKQLEQRMEQLNRSAKRQAAPFSRGLPKTDPKTPGRKSGEDYGTKVFRAIPSTIDEVHEAPLPDRCPKCGGTQFQGERIEQQYQAEIPHRPIYRQFNVAVGQCTCCGKRVQGRHPLQTSDALGCCASQIGPDAQSAVVMLNKELGLSQGKISRFFQRIFNIKLTPGGSCQIMLRAADRCEPAYHAIVKRVQESDAIVPDETGWRIGGWLAWLHVAVAEDAVAYLIAHQRGFEASKLLIGKDYAGKMSHDGWVAYLRFWRAIHQACNGHLLRRCKEMLETAVGGAVIYPRKVKAILQEGLETRDLRDAGKITVKAARIKADELQTRMTKLSLPTKINADNERFSRHLMKNVNYLFTFLRHEGVDATNHKAEQAIRPAVVNRKVWGGNRTENGAVAQSILMSVLFTAQKNGLEAMEFMSRTLRALPNQRPLLLSDTG